MRQAMQLWATAASSGTLAPCPTLVAPPHPRRPTRPPAGFEKPSAIQQKGIVPFGKGLDVIQQAQSGTGKTATFCAGILQVSTACRWLAAAGCCCAAGLFGVAGWVCIACGAGRLLQCMRCMAAGAAVRHERSWSAAGSTATGVELPWQRRHTASGALQDAAQRCWPWNTAGAIAAIISMYISRLQLLALTAAQRIPQPWLRQAQAPNAAAPAALHACRRLPDAECAHVKLLSALSAEPGLQPG